ncbi:MAG: hypothetical protein U9Q92_02185 [archaeon]|nr:hypothetical protein [archaeon]
MGFMDSISDGWTLFKDSIKFLFKKPVFLIPIFFSWVVVASVVLYLRYYFEVPSSMELALFYIFLFMFIMTFSICIANIMMLEFMQQIESGERISFSKALKEALFLDLIKVIPVAIVWTIIWFIILILRALTSKSRSGRGEPSARDAARTLGGAESGPFSWFGLGLSMLEKLVRMIVFLALPAIAWENRGPFSAFRKSIEIIRKHPVQFLTTYTLTGVAALFMAIPLVIIFYLDDAGMAFSTVFWMAVIIYEGFVWTLSIYLEQMSVGMLYLWHLKWIRNGGTGKLDSVPKPDLMDDVHELKQSVVS